ncbi:MAG: G/U mismatch-specific DNA glycosylase [Anaerolineales bacterium]
MSAPPRPTAAELQTAAGKQIPDVIGPNLRVLLCGINPGLYSAAIGHHFGRPGNRFWPALYAGGFTPRLFSPYEDGTLLPLGIGITNVVERASAGENDLTKAELAAGGEALRAKVARYRPRCLAVLGVGAYRSAFARPKAVLGPQLEKLGETLVWVLPNPSGLNAHYDAAALAKLFAELRQALS